MRETLSSKKPLIIVITIGLVVITALLIYGILVTPARQPYRDALAQYNNTNAALSRTNVSLNAGGASDEEFEKGLEAVKASFVSLDTENKALSKTTVLTDGEGKALYVKYDKDLKAYATYNTNVLESMKKVRPVLHSCSAAMDEVTVDAQGAGVIRACADKMQAATDVPDEDYKKLAEDFQKSYAELATILEQMASISDKNSAEYQQLSEQRSEIVNNFSEASTAFSKSVQAKRKAILSTSSANDLKVYLEEKSRVF